MPKRTKTEDYEKQVYNNSPRKNRSFKWLLFLIVVAIVGVGSFFARDFVEMYYAHDDMAQHENLPMVSVEEPIEFVETEGAVVSIWNLYDAIKPASELITTEYIYTDADVFENYKQIIGLTLPFTTNKTVFTYSGVIKIGIDFDKIKIDVNEDSKVISVSLPPVQVVSNEIDTSSFKYYDVSSSVFNQTDMEDVTELITQLKQNKKEKILSDETILLQAEQNCQEVLLGFLKTAQNVGDYTIKFK